MRRARSAAGPALNPAIVSTPLNMRMPIAALTQAHRLSRYGRCTAMESRPEIRATAREGTRMVLLSAAIDCLRSA